MHRLVRLPLICTALFGVVALPARAGGLPNYVMFFQEWSAAFDDPALRVIEAAAQWVKAHPGARLTVTGAADLTGGRRANVLLSELRAQVVTDQLEADGVDPKTIHQVALGSVDYAMSSQESRRVVISIEAP